MTQDGPRTSRPVFCRLRGADDFAHGRYDYTTSYPLARDYFDRLDAPVNGFYTFEDSAHSPAFEQPEKMLRVLRDDVVERETRLADAEQL